MINELAHEAFKNAYDKGFYEKPIEMGTRLMLITSEIAEALEADRKGRYSNIEAFEIRLQDIYASMPNRTPELEKEAFIKCFESNIKDSFFDEIADAVIRIFDLSGYMKADLEKHIKYKMQYNSYREHKHGKNY
jgi:NTP pyrophosphatase (non-canonical NTP hydrolase)